MALNLQVDNELSDVAQEVKVETGTRSGITLSANGVGIGTTTPRNPLSIRASGKSEHLVSFEDPAGAIKWHINQNLNGKTPGLNFVESGVKDGRLFIQPGGNVGVGTVAPRERLEVLGSILATGDVKLEGEDCAEAFDVDSMSVLEPGMVMVIGDEEQLHQCTEVYDRRVAGVLSGAGECRPGILLGHRSSPRRRLPLALNGKVYCMVDAGYSPVDVGDLLTTSSTPGYAMKATDVGRAFGAVIGKALRPLAEGRGLIPILVCLT